MRVKSVFPCFCGTCKKGKKGLYMRAGVMFHVYIELKQCYKQRINAIKCRLLVYRNTLLKGIIQRETYRQNKGTKQYATN